MNGTRVSPVCPSCGPQELPAHDVTLRLSGRAPELNHYLFTCPACEAVVEQPAPPIIAQALASTREVARVYWEPAALLERRPSAALHPLTEDEVFEAMVRLYAAPDALLCRMPEVFR